MEPQTSPSQTPSHSVGPITNVPSDNLFTFCFSTPFQHAPNTHIPHSVGRLVPEHTFGGQPIPPHRSTLINAGTGASLSWQRARADVLRIARYFDYLIKSELNWDGKAGREPIVSPERTILLHLPNCFAFPLLMLAGAASLCTISPISTLLTPTELANVLAKARPQLIFTTTGSEGEEKLRKGLQLLLDRPEEDVGLLSGSLVKKWAKRLASSWDAGHSGNSIERQRVWTVDMAADYYGSSTNAEHSPVLLNPRDWTHLLSPPQDSQVDALQHDAFKVRNLSQEEQTRRIVLLLWSSGTTGASKGVLLSHRNLVASMVGNWIGCPHMYGVSQGPFGGGETWVALAPWCHVYGITTLLLPAFALGATLILPPSPKFDLATYLRLVTKYRATTMHIAPPVAVTLRSTPLLDQTRPESQGIDLSSVRTLLSGGAPTPTEVIKAIYDRTGKMLQIGYGATEAGSNAHAVALDLTHLVPDSLEELGSVGTPMGNLEICIRPTEGTTEEEIIRKYQEVLQQGNTKRANGECAPIQPSISGEILLRGPHVTLGYYSGLASNDGSSALDAAITKNAMTEDGYYRTGDEGVLDYRGRLWITGRIKELIKVRGFQVAPPELDSLFAKHPELSEAAAAGILDLQGEEQVVLYVVPLDASVLSDSQKQQELAGRLSDFVTDRAAYYKWPRYYVFTPALLKNPTGKILRKDLHTLIGTRHQAPGPIQKKANL